ncbi:MAG: hotdog fold thioesterase [Alphaproteobacteria bacterium]|nr:hotdog fold thioesterase [Alphaproteobacteria bacterium]
MVRAHPTPLGQLLGIEVMEAAPDRVVATMRVRSDLCTFPAILHGGAVMALADTAGATATVINLPKGATTTTLESKTNFLAAAPEGQIVTAICEPVHKGKTTQVWQTKITREDGRLVALVTQSQLVMMPK